MKIFSLITILIIAMFVVNSCKPEYCINFPPNSKGYTATFDFEVYYQRPSTEKTVYYQVHLKRKSFDCVKVKLFNIDVETAELLEVFEYTIDPKNLIKEGLIPFKYEPNRVKIIVLYPGKTAEEWEK